MGLTHSCLVDKSKGNILDLIAKNKCFSILGASAVFLILIIIVFLVQLLFTFRCNEETDKDKIIQNIENSMKPFLDSRGDVYDTLKNIDETDIKKTKLKNLYIASSYNTARASHGCKNIVTDYPIINALNLGARFLDFEIYDHPTHGPVVAAGDYNNVKIKSTDNYLTLNHVFEIINEHDAKRADPLFLNFRMKIEKNSTAFQKFINKLTDWRGKWIGKQYISGSWKNWGVCGDNCTIEVLISELLDRPLEDFKNKIIVICNDFIPINIDGTRGNPNNEMFGLMQTTNLENKVIHLTNNTQWGSPLIDQKCFNNVKEIPNADIFIDENKKNLTLVYPDYYRSIKNINPQIPFSYGCQIVAMNYQTYDSNLKKYIQFFDDNGGGKLINTRWRSFKKKPDELIYIPTTESYDEVNSAVAGAAMECMKVCSNGPLEGVQCGIDSDCGEWGICSGSGVNCDKKSLLPEWDNSVWGSEWKKRYNTASDPDKAQDKDEICTFGCAYPHTKNPHQAQNQADKVKKCVEDTCCGAAYPNCDGASDILQKELAKIERVKNGCKAGENSLWIKNIDDNGDHIGWINMYNNEIIAVDDIKKPCTDDSEKCKNISEIKKCNDAAGKNKMKKEDYHNEQYEIWKKIETVANEMNLKSFVLKRLKDTGLLLRRDLHFYKLQIGQNGKTYNTQKKDLNERISFENDTNNLKTDLQNAINTILIHNYWGEDKEMHKRYEKENVGERGKWKHADEITTTDIPSTT